MHWNPYYTFTNDPVVPPPPDDVVKTGTGGIDPKRRAYKPSGLLPRRDGRQQVEDRIDESAIIHAEVNAKLAREFEETEVVAAPVITMSAAEIDWEIGLLLRKKMRTEEDEVLLLLLMAAASV